MKKKKPSSINAVPEVADFISRLDKGSYPDKIITKGRKALEQDICAGKAVQKKKIPKYYMKKYELHSLYVLDLDSSSRLTYTLLADGAGVSVNILEIFLSHKKYERRFKYS